MVAFSSSLVVVVAVEEVLVTVAGAGLTTEPGLVVAGATVVLGGTLVVV